MVSQKHRAGMGSIPAWAGQPNAVDGRIAAWRVYPRVGGATAIARSVIPVNGGLSPRGRGNRLTNGTEYNIRGSIPAWAGQPFVDDLAFWEDRVYPRVGGATLH